MVATTTALQRMRYIYFYLEHIFIDYTCVQLVQLHICVCGSIEQLLNGTTRVCGPIEQMLN